MLKIYLGFDISTSCIGISFFDEKGELFDIKHIKLKTDKMVLPEHRYLSKSGIFKEYIQDFKKYDVIGIFIEEPLVSSNNIFTANTLLKFNGICSFLLYQELNVVPQHLSVYEVRKIISPELIKINDKGKEVLSFPKGIEQKEYIFTKIKNKFSKINWIYNKNGELIKENYDMSDAIAVGVACLIKNNLLKKI